MSKPAGRKWKLSERNWISFEKKESTRVKNQWYEEKNKICQ